MPKQARDVTGGDEQWVSMVPGLGLLYFILGWWTVPIETFLRRDQGERYFTRSNFFAGLAILLAFNFFAHMLGGVFGLFSRNSEKATSYMGVVIFLYVIIGIIHFFRMWWKDIIHEPDHSFAAGRSWLRPLGQAVMFLLNLILNNIVRLIFKLHPKLDERKLPDVLPVLQDADTFTERFIEPTVCFYLALKCFSHGQAGMGWWLIFSVMALNLYTGLRHQAERGRLLDYRDSIIEAKFYHQYLAGQTKKNMGAMERMINNTAKAVKDEPSMLSVIEEQDSSLASAIERRNARRQNSIPPDEGLEAVPQAA